MNIASNFSTNPGLKNIRFYTKEKGDRDCFAIDIKQQFLKMNMEKRRILNADLARIVATLKHGEMIYIADAGSAYSDKAIYPLDPSVEYLDLGAVTGSPTTIDIVKTLYEAGDFEGAVAYYGTEMVNPDLYNCLVECFGKEKIREIPYCPEYYWLRDRCNAVIQTGDYSQGANVILIGGYPSADIDLDVLMGKSKLVSDESGMFTMSNEEFEAKYGSKK